MLHIYLCFVRLDDPGIETRWRQNFQHPSRPALGPTQPPIQRLPGFIPRVSRNQGVALTTPPSSAEVKESVELYPYSSFMPCSTANFTSFILYYIA
jgi:hypothetical protein